jgi:predicted  nucleic acid-binding Zn-ribbon protein
MIDPAPASHRRGLCALFWLGCLVLGASQASALPRVQVAAAPRFLLVQAQEPAARPDSKQAQENQQAPFAELNQVLETTRAKLEELSGAAASLAERRKEVDALKQENERLAAQLEQVSSRQAELESSGKRAEGRIAELTNAVDEAVREAKRLDQELAGTRQQNAELEQRLAQADSTRDAAQADAAKTRTEVAAKLTAASDAAERSKAELADVRAELQQTRQDLATAKSARQQAAARADEMQQALARSGTEAERLKGELAAVKEQLGQAATAAVEAERARQAAGGEVDQLRGDAQRARADLAAAQSQVERFKSANTELEKQIASLSADSKAAMETARQTLVAMGEKIDELNAALAGAGLAEETPSGPEMNAAAVADERSPEGDAPAGVAQAAPSEPTGEAGPEQRAAQSTQGPTTAPAQADAAGLKRFDANVRYLNSRAMEAAGADLFSGIEAAGDGVVHVSTTPAWRNIPPAGQRSYLNSLFDLWTVAKEGKGPRVVRIVDASGRVLLEKSGDGAHE